VTVVRLRIPECRPLFISKALLQPRLWYDTFYHSASTEASTFIFPLFLSHVDGGVLGVGGFNNANKNNCHNLYT